MKKISVITILPLLLLSGGTALADEPARQAAPTPDAAINLPAEKTDNLTPAPVAQPGEVVPAGPDANSAALDKFMTAAEKGDLTQVRQLLQSGVPVDARDAQGFTALARAARGGHAHVVDFLIKNRAGVDAAASTWTPLSLACIEGRPQVVKTLLAAGANVEHKDESGRTPLMHAAAGGNVDVLNQLLKKGANIEARDTQGYTPLMIALESEHGETAKALINAGAEVEAQGNMGWTPLMYAVLYEMPDVVDLLLSKGADVNAKSQDGWSPMRLATENANRLIIELLSKKGAQ